MLLYHFTRKIDFVTFNLSFKLTCYSFSLYNSGKNLSICRHVSHPQYHIPYIGNFSSGFNFALHKIYTWPVSFHFPMQTKKCTSILKWKDMGRVKSLGSTSCFTRFTHDPFPFISKFKQKSVLQSSYLY